LAKIVISEELAVLWQIILLLSEMFSCGIIYVQQKNINTLAVSGRSAPGDQGLPTSSSIFHRKNYIVTTKAYI
jgi:hypothetical protein